MLIGIYITSMLESVGVLEDGGLKRERKKTVSQLIISEKYKALLLSITPTPKNLPMLIRPNK